MAKLSDAEVQSALAGLPDWRREGDSICRTFQFHDFLAAIAFVNRIADAAQAADHHPDIDIRYNKVGIVLSTHDQGGITAKDTALAGQIDTLQKA